MRLFNLKKAVASGLSLVVGVTSMNLNTMMKVYATDGMITPLLISEIVADTHQRDQITAGGTDAFEYIELYNASERAISLNDYIIRNMNGTKATDWPVNDDVVIEPRETLVVWVQNSESAELTNDDFASYYGINQEEVRIVKTTKSVNGFSNTGIRSMQLVVKNTNQTIYQVTYNDAAEKAQTKKGINFAYASGNMNGQTLSYDEEPTPGNLIATQNENDIPVYALTQQNDASIQVEANSTTDGLSSFPITSTTTLSSIVMNAYVEATINGSVSTYPCTYQEGNYVASIPTSALENVTTFSYVVKMSDGVNEITSAQQQVSVQTTGEEKKVNSPLLVTEVVPNTDNVDGSDAYEYFEIYNASDMVQNVDDYDMIYDNGSTRTKWTLNERNVQIQPGQRLIVWIKNEKNIAANYTIEDFKTYYETKVQGYTSTLQAGVDFATLNSEGFSNTGSRQYDILTKSGKLLQSVSYDATQSANGKLDVDEAIEFHYDGDQVTTQYDKQPTLDSIVNDQVIGTYKFETIENPSITMDSSAIAQSTQDYTISLQNTNLQTIFSLTVDMYNGDTKVCSVNGTYDEKGNVKAIIPSSRLQNVETFTYRVSATDGKNEATFTSGTIRVSNDSSTMDKTKIPPLVITEIMPDSENAGGADAYEFIEIYNNSNKDINLKDYKLLYNYPDSGSDSIWWETETDQIIRARDTLVFWVKNGGNTALTVEDFNQKFNTILDENHLIPIECGGMSNSGIRGLKIVSNVKDVLDYVLYNENGADNTFAQKSIIFQNQYTNDTFKSVLVNDQATPTPGSISRSDVPHYEAELVASNETNAPQIQDLTATKFSKEENLIFSILATSQVTKIKTVSLFVKDNLSNEFEKFNILRSNGDYFNHSLSKIDIALKQSYTYYYEVSDGFQTVRTQEKTIENSDYPGIENFNIKDQEVISKTKQIITTGNRLLVDNKDVSENSVSSIPGNGLIAFDATQTDAFFKNAVAVGDTLLGVFNEGTYSTIREYAYGIDASQFDPVKKQITVSFHAGNKANPLEHNIENNDDFAIKNVRLLLPDGTTLRPISYKGVKGIGAIEHTDTNWQPNNPIELTNYSPETEINMGDGTSKVEILYATFQLSDENFSALRYMLDTTTLSDGEHTLSNDQGASVNCIVDNTAPLITTNMKGGETYRKGEITASASDAISENASIHATLDGQTIELPYIFSSKTLEAKTHTLTLTSSDDAGNIRTQTIQFITPAEDATIQEITSGKDGSTFYKDPTLSLQVNDSMNDPMKVLFKKGKKLTLADDEITSSQGIANISGTNTKVFEENSTQGFPFEEFEVVIAKDYSDAKVQVEWKGTSNNQKTFMYVYNITTKTWDKVNAKQSMNDNEMSLKAMVETKDHVENNRMRIMVQNGEGYHAIPYAPTTQTGNPNDLPREDYDFTFAIESDTQYYNEDFEGNPSQTNNGSYQYQLDIHNFILKNRERMNLQYLFHNGDIIDDEPIEQEWINADNAYKLLDDANFPYGVLAGNHDVGHLSGDYTRYSKYFGEARYANNPWYQGSYKDNRGHYALISIDGIDFLMMFMGWGIGDEEIKWMNDVLAQYPERKAILNFHEYLLASSGLGEEPQRVYDEVVAKNPNVCMVLSGHYHNAQTRVDEFDDDKDGTMDRKVYQMLFDYQGLNEGGMGYMRLMHFDVEGERMIVRTYSPSLDDYNAKDETNIGNVAGINGQEDFVVPFADLGIKPKSKALKTNSLQVNLYGNEVIGEVNNVTNGEVSYNWKDAQDGTYGWYAQIVDEYDGNTYSDIQNITIDKPKVTVGTVKVNSVEANTYSSAKLSWKPVEGATGYEVHYSDEYDQEDYPDVIKTTKTNATIYGLKTGQKYFVKVRAYYEENGKITYGKFSSRASVTPKLKAPVITSVNQNTYGTLEIKWKGVEGAYGYYLERRAAGSDDWKRLKTFDGDVRSAISRSLDTGTRYEYRLRAIRYTGDDTTYSNYSNVKGNTPVMRTTTTSVTKKSSTSAKVSWKTVSGASGYEVFRATSSTGKYSKLKSVNADTKSLVSKSLVKGKTYYYKVRAYRIVKGKKVYNNYSKVVSYTVK